MTDKIKAASTESGSDTRARRGEKNSDAEVGNALRSAYQQTVNEGVPDELMDLLNRLD